MFPFSCPHCFTGIGTGIKSKIEKHMNLDKDEDQRGCKSYKRYKLECENKRLPVRPVGEPLYLYNIPI